eukprot:CAMPEP_0170550128 /NCGR_PEP_ID=MMETSP0211-20121228/8181_1 /TAXON_ID=311385 /ORGANISM="Pseudokeronopsis sp., Strain OXSARD2" /LENGTH=34 /DNA_ID= /DNA_START= /DNA_END= /DNA_ORIENTATION=
MRRFRSNFLFVMDNLDDIGKDYTSELSQFIMKLV